MVVTIPSVQVVINENGSCDVLSTHEQMMNVQLCTGCEFPYRQAYQAKLMDCGRKLGGCMAVHGIRGHFGADFLCVPEGRSEDDEDFDVYSVEINLRLTGTTPPFMTLKLLTQRFRNASTGLFLASPLKNYRKEDRDCHDDRDEKCKYYVASDSVTHPALRQLDASQLREVMEKRPDLHWNGTTQTISSMAKTGKVGIAAMANSRDDARVLFREATEYLIYVACQIVKASEQHTC